MFGDAPIKASNSKMPIEFFNKKVHSNESTTYDLLIGDFGLFIHEMTIKRPPFTVVTCHVKIWEVGTNEDFIDKCMMPLKFELCLNYLFKSKNFTKENIEYSFNVYKH